MCSELAVDGLHLSQMPELAAGGERQARGYQSSLHCSGKKDTQLN